MMARQGVAISARPRGVPARRPSRRRQRQSARATGEESGKTVWISGDEAVVKRASELGVASRVLDESESALSGAQALHNLPVARRESNGQVKDSSDGLIGEIREVKSPEEARNLETEAANGGGGLLIFEAEVFQMIEAENLLAAAQRGGTHVMGVASCAKDCESLLTALETGLSGVILRTDSVEEVDKLATALSEPLGSKLKLEAATVTRIEPFGMGERACLDLASSMVPGEGMLVGSFAKVQFLVHSECLQTGFVSSREWRVNAGVVSSYCLVGGGKTNYLSEFRCGTTGLVVNSAGEQREELVARVKVERRPMVLVEAELETGDRATVVVQNAETVRLVQPQGAAASVANGLKEGDQVLCFRSGGPRHTGIQVDEETFLEM